jgi:hypothetical protein
MYILTLPGFHWERLDGVDSPLRNDHSCAVVGNRQVLSWGGYHGAMGSGSEEEEEDPFHQGIGIFDMTTLEWSNSFNASASAYRTPDLIQDWYDEG